MHHPISLEIPGTFGLGCNYWASHAGTAMWSDWRPDVVADDMQKLSAHGIEWVRVFTLWPDFQPISVLRTIKGAPFEMRFGELPLPLDPVGQAGVSAEMLNRFAELCVLAEKYGLKLIVGLVTGWMSGRLFVPPALSGLDPIVDPTSIAWQIKMVRTIVTHAREQRAVAAWDLGNECNCMGHATSRDAAYLWTAAIANAIRAADASRPVVSGMHSLGTPAGNGNKDFPAWMIDDQGELTDLLTTHPYPYWTRHTRADAVNTLRTTLHATAETRLYSDIGGKPCFVEEIGSMGPMVAGDEASADFARANLFSLWANDCRVFMWWCAHDQTELIHAPYDWNGVETELGLLRNDGSAKPVLREMSAFRDFLGGLPFKNLPRRRTDGVCLLTRDQDDWAAAFGAFVLGKQAKLDLEFRHIMQEIPEADLYLLPSIQGPSPVPRRQWLNLLSRVKAGATLYVSLGEGIVPHFNEVAGVELISRAQKKDLEAALSGAADTPLPMYGADDLHFTARGAEVLGTRADTGTPVLWRNRYGKGQVVVYAAPLEIGLTLQPGAFEENAPPFWRVYDEIQRTLAIPRALTLAAPAVAATEHPLADGRTVVILINHTATEQDLSPVLTKGFALGEVWRGEVHAGYAQHLKIRLPAFDAAVFALSH